MAITNLDRVGKAMELLQTGLAPFVERELRQIYKDEAHATAVEFAGADRLLVKKPLAEWDVVALLRVMWDGWNAVFKRTLGHAERSLVSELKEARNRWAHQQSFSGDDAYRTLDSAARLLTAVSAPQADEIDKMKQDLLRVRYDEQVRTEKRRAAGTAIETQASSTLKPWREVITPHADVASGRYQQAEFAADLWQVYLGEGGDEYRNPSEFYRRTFITESLRRLLVGAAQRLASAGGDPVIQLQTNFGGGKTHSMLALYHLFSGTAPTEMMGAETIMQEAAVTNLPTVKRVVLVGNKISPGNPVKKPDGTVVRTLWGEMAWQLGGRKAFDKICADDEKATSPGDAIRALFNEYGPCLILIDEWVAYARQLHDQSDLPAGSFDTQFTFAQALTESAKNAKHCLLVISLPASDTTGSPHTQADDAEVGGQRGREALERLRNVVGRVESPWRPATAEEGFEIVRRRLFDTIQGENYIARDATARAFYDLYRAQQQEFPPECRNADYEQRLRAAYPIHPEVFDRLYTDWSTLVKFQRTRGVLRLMAAVIHSLWEKGDRNPLIMPSMIPLDEQRVRFEFTRYLPDNWDPVIEKDIDGASSLPLRLDSEMPGTLGRFSAHRRVARSIYLGSAPTPDAANRGLEDRRITLGCVIPGESAAGFGDALRHLAGAATFLYQDGHRYWYSTQPTVTKLAEDRAEQFKRDTDKVIQEIEKRLRLDLHQTGDFLRVHPVPQTGQDVPDDHNAGLVVLGTQKPYSRESGAAAEVEAKAILEYRGNAPRLFRNTLVFLAADKTRLQDLDDAVCRLLAWDSIIAERETLDLTPHQEKQARAQRAAADTTVAARLPETYQWLLVPTQSDPQAPIEWQVTRLTGQDPLAVRASRRLKGDESLVATYAATNLRIAMDKVPLWRGEHVAVKQLVDDFARYLYLPRLRAPEVLVDAIRGGPALTTWETETFAYADGFDEATGRYRGLRFGQQLIIAGCSDPGLLVKPEVARRQINDQPEQPPIVVGGPKPGVGTGSGPQVTSPPPNPKRFHGSVALDVGRVGASAGRVSEEVIAHLAGLVGARVTVTLDIDAAIPDGVPDQVVRVVMENARTMKFVSYGFETD